MRRSTTSNDGWFWTNLRIYTPFRALAVGITAATLTVGCGREGGMARTMGELNYFDQNHAPDAKKTAAEQAADSAERLRRLAARGIEGELTEGDRAKLLKEHDALVRNVASVNEQFSRDRQKLEELGADEALERLDRVEHAVQVGSAGLTKAFGAIEGANAEPSRAALRSLQKAVDQIAPVAEPEQLSSNLGFGASNAEGAPAVLSAGIVPAYSAPTPGVTASALPREPESADVAATPETRISTAVGALAERRDHDPVKIYQYVRNKIEFDPYYGIRKGAPQTLREKSGSDADQAALLVALLRASGTPARFVRGTAELPATQVANWLGIDPSKGQVISSAPEILAASGIPTTQVRVNGQLSKVRFEHFWVEAHVAGEAYRGVEEGQGEKRWIALDPSIKGVDFVGPDPDAPSLTSGDHSSFLAGYEDSARTLSDGGLVFDDFSAVKETAGDILRDKLDAIPTDVIGENKTAEYLVGKKVVKGDTSSYLPASLPFRAAAVISELRAIPASLTASVQLKIDGADPLSSPSADDETDGGLSYSEATPALASKRITVTYSPASTGDAEIVDAYHGLLNAPSYAASLVPVVRVDGRVVAAGTRGVSTGYQQRFQIVYRQPGFAPRVIENAITVGGITTLALDLGRKSAEEMASRTVALQKAIEGVTASNALTDARMGAMLGLAGEFYFLQNDAANALLTNHEVDARRALSGALVATSINTSTIGGFPVGVRLTGSQMDVDADDESVVSLRADGGGVEDYISRAGARASQTEGEALDAVFGGSDGVSTTRVISEAAAQGVPLYTITQNNAEEKLSRLTIDATTLRSVRAALQDGNEVLIPAREVTVGSWTGTGYIVAGEGRRAFMISGGLSGGKKGSPIVDFMIYLAECIWHAAWAMLEVLAIGAGIAAGASWIAAGLGVTLGGIATVGMVIGIFIPVLLALALIALVIYAVLDHYASDGVMPEAVQTALGSKPIGAVFNYINRCTPIPAIFD